VLDVVVRGVGNVEKNTVLNTPIQRQVESSPLQKTITTLSVVKKKRDSNKMSIALVGIQAIVENGGSQSLK